MFIKLLEEENYSIEKNLKLKETIFEIYKEDNSSVSFIY